MRIVCLSDTHCHHADIDVPDGDVLFHTGDACMEGTLVELQDYGEWLVKQPHARKIITLGNHDIAADRLAGRQYVDTLVERGVEVLHGTSTELGGLKVWGTPYSRTEHSPVTNYWVFGHRDGIDNYFQVMPSDADIVLTHGPSYGLLDVCPVGRTRFGQPINGSVGSKDLRKRIKEVQPFLHIHGHIHECSGHRLFDKTWTVNAAMMDRGYYMTNPPRVFDIVRNDKDDQLQLVRV